MLETHGFHLTSFDGLKAGEFFFRPTVQGYYNLYSI